MRIKSQTPIFWLDLYGFWMSGFVFWRFLVLRVKLISMLGNLWVLVLYWFCLSLSLSLSLSISLSLTCSFSSALFDYLIWLLKYNSLCCFKRIVARLTRWWFLGIGKYAPFLIQLSKCKNWLFCRCRYCLILLDIRLSFENYSR